MKIGIESETVPASLKRYQHEVSSAQIERNYRYMGWRAADNDIFTPLGNLIWKKAQLATADARLSRIMESGVRQQCNFVVGRLRLPLPSVPLETASV